MVRSSARNATRELFGDRVDLMREFIQHSATGNTRRSTPRSSLSRLVGGLVGTNIGTSRCRATLFAPVPLDAASVTAQPCRLDGHMVARRLQVPVKTRCEKLEALKPSRYLRVTLLVNLRTTARRTDKLDQMSRGLCLPAATHLGIASGKHLFDLEPAPSLLLKLTPSHPCSAAGFGCFGCRWWCKRLAAVSGVDSSSARWQWSLWSLPWSWSLAG